jgi:hypothetical protein
VLYTSQPQPVAPEPPPQAFEGHGEVTQPVSIGGDTVEAQPTAH